MTTTSVASATAALTPARLTEMYTVMLTERLLSERDTIRMKVEAMLDAIAVLDPETAEVMRR